MSKIASVLNISLPIYSRLNISLSVYTGITRNYAEVDVDKPVRDASMNLMRSIPRGELKL